MKKIYSLIIFSLIFFTGERSFAQSFSFINKDTVECGMPSSDVECYLGDSIKNNTPNNLTVDVVRVQDDIGTSGWTSAFCLAVCYLPTKDSVRFSIQPNKSQSIIIHFYTSAAPDSGTILFKVKDVNNPSVVAYQRYHGYTTCTGVNELSSHNANVAVYPSPFVAGNDFSMNISNVQNGGKEISLLVYNIYGSEVSRVNNLKEGNNTLNLNLPAGIYSYSLISNNVPINSGKLAVSK